MSRLKIDRIIALGASARKRMLLNHYQRCLADDAILWTINEHQTFHDQQLNLPSADLAHQPRWVRHLFKRARTGLGVWLRFVPRSQIEKSNCHCQNKNTHSLKRVLLPGTADLPKWAEPKGSTGRWFGICSRKNGFISIALDTCIVECV